MVRGLLLFVLAQGLAVVGAAVLVLTAHHQITGTVHQNWHRLAQLHQQPQQTWQMKDNVLKQIRMTKYNILHMYTNVIINPNMF